MICYECSDPCHYIFDDGRCEKCTRVTMSQVTGERNMTREDVCEVMVEVLNDAFNIPPDKLDWEVPISQQGLDSLDQIELVMWMEDCLDVHIGMGDEKYENKDVTPNMFVDRLIEQFGE